MRHITWAAYERATYHEINTHKRASGQERRKRDRSSRHVCQRVCEFRDLSVLDMSQQCIVKLTSLFISYEESITCNWFPSGLSVILDFDIRILMYIEEHFR